MERSRSLVASILVFLLLFPAALPKPAPAQTGVEIGVVIAVIETGIKIYQALNSGNDLRQIREEFAEISRQMQQIETKIDLVLETLIRLDVKIDERFDQARRDRLLATIATIRRNFLGWSESPEQYQDTIEEHLQQLQTDAEYLMRLRSFANYHLVAIAMIYDRDLLLLLGRGPAFWQGTFGSYAQYFDENLDPGIEGSLAYVFGTTKLRIGAIRSFHEANPSGWCRIGSVRACKGPCQSCQFSDIREWSGTLATGYSHTGKKKLSDRGVRCHRESSECGECRGGDHRFNPVGPEAGQLFDEPIDSFDWNDPSWWNPDGRIAGGYSVALCPSTMNASKAYYEELVALETQLESALGNAARFHEKALILREGQPTG